MRLPVRLAVTVALGALVLGTLPSVAVRATEVPAWVHNEAGETPDPAIRYGQLPNGMRYALMRNATPPGQVVIRYVIEAGVADQGPGEAEHAHLVEHLAFAASDAFPEGDAISQLQKAGLELGVDANAFTGAQATVYALQLPAYSPERLALALRFLRAVSDGPHFAPNDVLREKNIVTAEIGLRENQSARATRANAALLYPELPYLRQTPTDRLAGLNAATPESLRAFHDRWYRPDHAFLVIVGDMDPDAAAVALTRAFDGWRATGAAPPTRAMPAFGPPATRVAVARENGLSAGVMIAAMRPMPEAPLTLPERRDRIASALGLAIVRARLAERLPLDPTMPLVAVTSFEPREFGLSRGLALSASVEPGRWREGLTTLAAEADRATAQGFTTEEVDREVMAALKGLRARSAGSATRPSEGLADQIADAYRVHEAVVLPERSFQRHVGILEALTPADVKSAFVRDWTASPLRVFVAGGPDLSANPAGALAAVDAGARASGALAPALVAVKEFALPGAPGHAVETKQTADATLVRLSNGVLVNLKTTKFRAGEVLARMRVGGGLAAFAPGQPLPAAPIGLLAAGGMGGLDAAEVDARLRGVAASAGGIMSTDAFVWTSTTNRRDLETQLKLWTALVGQPGFDPRGDGLLRHRFEAALEGFDATPAAAFNHHWGRYSHGGDPRWRDAQASDAPIYAMAKLKAAYAPILAAAPVEVTLVGDFDEADAIALAERTLGRLPTRVAVPPRASGGEIPRFPSGAAPVTWTHRGDPNRTVVAFAWASPDGSDVLRAHRLGVLTRLLQFRVFNELRQVSGATYSPFALMSACSCEKGFGYIGVAVEVARADVPLAERTIRSVVAPLRDLGPDSDDFARTIMPIRAQALAAAKTNAEWLGLLDEAQTQPALTADGIAARTAYDTMTADDLRPLAKAVFAATPVEVRVEAAGAGTVTAPSAAAGG